ncbi:xylose isomerase [Anaerolineaceae bacterium oral taxon 439]|nr:xylose isomerase [Anaerolineaceae bacterium oral taxon 439]
MTAYYPEIPQVKYEGPKSENPLAFKFYNPDEIVAGKKMKDQLKFSAAYWHTICASGADMFGVPTADKTWGRTDPMALAEAKVGAFFEILDKLQLEYFAFHDRDIAPEGASLTESNQRLDRIVDLIEGLMKETGKKLLWGTANLFSNPRYMHGAGTSCNADAFAFAAAQVKKALEISVRLNAAGYTFWGGREGYETLLNTNMGLELDNMARFLRLTTEYGRSIGFKGTYYIEPKPKEPTKHQYDFDAATVIGFLRKYGLDMKLNLEANHGTLAGHTFQHELRVARTEGMFGSVDANIGDLLLGWDTDQFPNDVYDATLAMYEVLKAGGFTTGGLNFDSKARRASFKPEDVFISHIMGMDSMALGLRIADRLIQDGRLDRFVAERYASFDHGIGKRIVDGTVTIQELEAHALKIGDVSTNASGRQEYLEGILNQVMFGQGA